MDRKRRKLSTTNMRKPKSSDSGRLITQAIEPSSAFHEPTTQVHPGVVVVDGCEVAGEEGSCRLPRVAELSLNESEDKSQDGDFNDKFPDEILLSIFKYMWRPIQCWEAAKVCKRWYVLLARNQLLKRSNHISGQYPCTRSKGKDRSVKASLCNGTGQTLTVTKIESEWKLSMHLLNSCRRHTHTLEIKDCTHVSVRGYQLIAAFVSNLKTIRLHSCNSMDDPSLDVILGRCSRLCSIHLSMVPKLTLRNVDKKAPLLHELEVYGCPNVTATTIFSVLRGCPNLRTLCLSALGGSHDWDPNEILVCPPLRLQNLKLSNTLAVTDVFMHALSQRLLNLRTLNLTNCPLLSDDGLQHINSACGRSLHRLVVTSCPGISDNSVQALARVGANLHDVSLAGTNVGDSGIESLISSDIVSSKLRNLSVARCRRVTDAGLLHLVSRRDQLVSFKTLDVQNCPGVSIFALRTLRNEMTRIRIVSDKNSVTISE